jgi:hypothetical protein
MSTITESSKTAPKPQHVMWVIGFMSDVSCYLDIPREEAEARYRAAHDGELLQVKRLVFGDEFNAYDISDAEVVSE